jgi:hypothetical protein
MKLPLSLAEKLIQLCNGVPMPSSKIKSASIQAFLDNGIIRKQLQGKSKAMLYLSDPSLLQSYLKNQYGINDLRLYVDSLKTELTRAEAVEAASNSKITAIRTFQGFLVNTCEPIEAVLGGVSTYITPLEGTFTFIYDYEGFQPAPDVTIVGVENPENFRWLQNQQYLFQGMKPLFVSRYPQSRDLIKWLMAIPNTYLHFGDFDFAGINIYWNEYKNHLGERARFFVPPNVEHLIAKHGNRMLYDNQKLLVKEEIKERGLKQVIEMLHKYKKGLEQEVLIKMSALSNSE